MYEIERSDSSVYEHCVAAVDTAIHTVLFCPSSAGERVKSYDFLRLDVLNRTYGNILRTALDSSQCWTALANFCEVVMRRKEQAERECRSLEKMRALLLTASSSDTDE